MAPVSRRARRRANRNLVLIVGIFLAAVWIISNWK